MFLFAVLSSGDRQDWLFKDEMNAAVKLGGGCAALARMQVPLLRFMHFFRRSSTCMCFGQDVVPVVAMTGCLAALVIPELSHTMLGRSAPSALLRVSSRPSHDLEVPKRSATFRTALTPGRSHAQLTMR